MGVLLLCDSEEGSCPPACPASLIGDGEDERTTTIGPGRRGDSDVYQGPRILKSFLGSVS